MLGRPDGIVLGMMTKGFGSFLLGTLLGASEFSELLEDNAESNADGGGLACQVSEERSKSPSKVTRTLSLIL